MSEPDPPQTAAMLDRLLAEFGPRLRAVIAARCPRQAGLDPDEIEQEVRIRLWQTLKSQPLISHPAAYLYRIALSVIVDQLRKRRARPDLDSASLDLLDNDPEYGSAASPSAGDELAQAVRVALAALPDRRRRPVQLHLQGFGFAEVARLLKMSDATARNLIYRGMEDLRALLRKAGWE